MILKRLENDSNNKYLSIKKRFLITNTLFKKELKKIKNKLIKERIKNDSVKYIRLIEYQNIQNTLNKNENKKSSIEKAIKFESAEVDISIPKKITIKLVFFQIISLIRWLLDKKRNFRIDIYILNAVADDLMQHIYEKKRSHNIEIIIPTQLIIFSKRKIFSNLQLNDNREKTQSLNFCLDKLYTVRELYYLKTELISAEICNFINYLSKFNFVKSILCFSNHQSYLENHLSSKYKNLNKKWKGVYIALHGGNYGISYGYPIMFYHCFDNLMHSPNFLLPIELHNHFFEDIDSLKKNLSLTLSKEKKILKKQYGFEIIKKSKKSKFRNDDLYIFANNLLPYIDPWTNFYKEFHIKETLERWKKFRRTWTKGKIYIVVRPLCENYLLNFYKKEFKEINLITFSKSYNLNNSTMIFEGQSSAIREHSRKSKFSIIYLPKRIFCLSENNYIEHDLNFKNTVKIVDDEKKLFNSINSLM